MLMSEKLCLTNDGHFHEYKFEGRRDRKFASTLAKVFFALQRILHQYPGLLPYKITIVQQLDERDYQQRLTFWQIMLDMFEENEDLTIIMSDEAHFYRERLRICVRENGHQLSDIIFRS